jgi:hypothetical protein
MALPTRVLRGNYADPYDAAQREFDSMLGRFLGQQVTVYRPLTPKSM